MENMAIWTAVSSTDPKFTSRVQQRGGFTSIDAYFQIRQATELWGPYGFRWGLRNLRRTLEKDLEMAILDAEFFYPVENETVSFEIGNSLFFVLKSKSGDKPDDEFIKKLETNTISKALSRLGFGADVFLGMFDDDGVYHSTCPGGVNIVTALPASDQKKLSGEDAMAFSL